MATTAMFDLAGYPLHDAAQHGDIEGMEKAIKGGIDVNALETDRKWTALHVAAETNQLEAIKKLSELGADMNARDKDDETPMHCAAFLGHSDAVGWLLAGGASTRVTNKYGMTPHEVALRHGKEATAKMILEES